MAPTKIEAWLGYGSSEEQGQVVQEAFEQAGIPVEVRHESAFPPEGNGAGFTIMVGLFGYTLASFVSGYLSAAGGDAWGKTKELLRTLREDHMRRYPSAPPTSQGMLIFKDVKRRAQVSLRTDLPDEAWAKLSELEIGEREDVSWNWDEEQREWVAYDLSGIEDRSAITRDHPDIDDYE